MIFRRKDRVPPLVEMAIDAARQLGFDGEAAYDEDRRELTVDGLGTVPLGPAMDRATPLTEAQQRPAMTAAVRRVVKAAPAELPDKYRAVPPELRERLSQHVRQLRISPDSFQTWQAIGRIERAGGIDGWQEPTRRAADRLSELAAGSEAAHYGLEAANLYRLLGEQELAREHAEASMARIRDRWDSDSIDPAVGELCAAELLAGRRARLPELAAQYGQPRTGPRWWPICIAAGAAEAGDRDSLRREVDAADRLAADEPVDAGGVISDRDLAEILRAWSDDLDSAPDQGAGGEPSRPRLVGPLAGVGAKRVSWDRHGRFAITLSAEHRLLGLTADDDVWDSPAQVLPELTWDPAAPLLAVVGGTLLVDGDGGARVGPDLADLLLAPSAEMLAVHRQPTGITVQRADGTVVVDIPALHAEWRPGADELLVVDEGGVARYTDRRIPLVVDDKSRGPLFARWSPAGTSIVVWGQYGTHDVLDEDGGQVSSFPSPAKSNLVAAIGSTVLVTAGDDGGLVVNDLVRGAVHGRLDVGAPVVRLDLDPSDRFAAATTLDDEVHVIALDALERVELHAPARIGRWSSEGTALACCDGDDLWLEVWD